MMPSAQSLIRNWRRILIWGAAALAMFALLGFFAAPPILKSLLTKQLTETLHREVSIREVRVNPFALSATLRGFSAKEPKGPETFASFEELYVNLESSSLFRWAAVVREVRLTRPFVRLVRRRDGSYNFSDLLPASRPQPAAPAKPLRFSVNNIRVIDGGADISDETVHRTHAVRELNLGIPFISNISSYVQTFVQPGISVQVNGTRYAIEGRTKPFAESQETTLDVHISDLDLPYYLAYAPPELLTFTMPSGRLDANLSIVFVRHQKTGDLLSVKGNVGLRQLALDDKQGNPVVRIPILGVELASVEPLARTAHLTKISLQSPELTLQREKTGVTNLETLIPKQQDAAQTTPKAPEPAADIPVLDIDEIGVTGAKVLLSDLFPSTPFHSTLAPVDLAVKQLSTRPGIKGTYTLSMQTEAKENLSLEGGVSLTPLAADGKVEGKSFFLKKYAPYYKDLVLFDIESGTLDFSSRYRYAQGGKEPEIVATEAAASLSALRIRHRNEKEDFLRIPELAITDTVADVAQQRITVGGVSTRKGFIAAKRLPSGRVDLQDLLPSPKVGAGQAAGPAGAESTPWVITLKQLAVEQYTAKIEDRAATEPITLTAEKVHVSADNISTAKNATGHIGLSLLLDKTATVSTRATVGLDPVRASGRVQVAGVILNRYAPYYKNLVVFDVQDGTLDLATEYRLTEAKGAFDVKLAGLATSLKTLILRTRDTKQEFLNIPLLAVKNTALDLSQQDIAVGEISTERGTVVVVRSREGEINLVKLLPRTAAAAETLAEAPVPAQPAVGPVPATPVRPWTVKAGAISVSQYRIQVTDEVPSDPVNVAVDDLNVRAQSLSTALNSTPGKASVSFRLDNGTVSADGTLDVAPIAADLQVDVKDVDIRPFTPYVADRVKVNLTGGRLSTSGHLQFSTKEPPGLQAKYTGEITLGKFAAVDKINAEDVLRWESLALRDLSVGYNPLSVRAKRVALADFFAHVVIEPSGRLNLQEIVDTSGPSAPGERAQPAPGSGQPAEADNAASNPAKDIQIEELTLQGGRVQFQDRSLTPSYSADMTEIGGRVSGLSSMETSLADVELRGRMNNTAPLEITGKINPLRQDLFADLRARFTGMDLSPTSPYSGKYVGYTIEKGKLSFDLAYHIDKRKLSSENKVFIDQFTFGEKVDSPTATSLPVKLAVALLKDRNGEIHLDIPVTGSIDDPQFSVWSVVLQIVGNLITKAVTSPFALLGAAFGGGEELQYVEFAPGRATIPEAGEKKIDALIAALSEKPGLKLEITGHVDPEADREGLKQYLLQRKVKAQKLNEMVKQGKPAVPVDDVVVSAEEYEKYLTLAYRAEPFPKPRNFIGMVKSLPVPEMEKLILTHIEAGDEELRQLAAQRATAVQQAILRSGKVDAERLFIVEPKTLAPEKKDKVKDSRVDFKIV